jgi:tRNA threonylcarbamoyladenosine modification (KEOPS) complex  Pcc1 subunit
MTESDLSKMTAQVKSWLTLLHMNYMLMSGSMASML